MGYKSWSKLVYAGPEGRLDQETMEFGSFTGFEHVPDILFCLVQWSKLFSEKFIYMGGGQLKRGKFKIFCNFSY